MSESNKRNFIVHGSILAIAGILVRIIGMLYRIPVVNIIGSEGNGIYGAAFNIYNIMLVLSSYGLPMAVSKLVSARFTKRRYKSAAKVLRCSLMVAVCTGGIAALLVFFGASFIENVIYGGGLPGLAIPLRILAPTIFLVAILGVIRGFFQGQSTMIPTAVSQILEQIVNAIVSIAAGYGMMKAFASSPDVAAYGAAGSTLGTAMGALTAVLFMGFLYGTPGSSTYEATHANTNNSTILTNLETWYNNNLKTYADAIADTVWCNDKTNVEDKTYNPWSYGGNATGLGYGTNKTYYGATQRLVSTSGSAGGTGPSLKCNGELSKITSKIGLITVDELAFAGYAYELQNTTTYLQENATNTYWWSLSPLDFNLGSAGVWNVGEGTFGRSSAGSTLEVRPSISIVSSATISGGFGTSEDPYVVE